jgi:hypothetical protein
MAIPESRELRKLYDQHHGNITEIAKSVDKPRQTVYHWYKKLGLAGRGVCGLGAKNFEAKAEESVELPDFGDDDIPVTEILDSLESRFTKREAYARQKEWFPIKVNIDGPIGLSFFGDPHLDDNGCHIPLLRHHCKLHADTEALFGVNIGDVENNWTGRLAKLYADQDTSKSTAHKLTEWFLKDAGIDWIVWLMGNHDLWGELAALIRAMNVKRIPMEDWQARFKLVFPNGRECKIWAAHDFKGHSMWNSLHGAQKAAHMKAEAHIFAAGHTHNWAIHQEESASRDFIYWLVRSRGYKFIDEYADRLGHFPQREGASITCVIDPDATSEAGFVQAFADMDKAVDYLDWIRR